MKYLLLLPFLAIILFTSCKNDDDATTLTLQSYIEDHPSLTPFNELVACAAGGQEGFLEDENTPLSVFFYPELNASDIRYFETENATDDPDDLNLFVEKTVPPELLFNGFLQRFALPKPDKETWARVSFIANDTLWYCKPVRLKMDSKPSQFAPELCEVDLTDPTEPIFSWQDGIADDNVIYFQVISDDANHAISGTYTTDLFFQYYQLDNVVFNVTRPGQAVPLELGRTYTFTLMGVSDDNWVNLIMRKSFEVQ